MHARALVDRGNQALVRRNLQGAETLFDEAASLWPDLAGAWYGLGKVAFQRGDLERAETDLLKAVELSPAAAQPRIYLGHVYLSKGDKKKGIDQWKTVLSHHPENAEAKRLLAQNGVPVE